MWSRSLLLFALVIAMACTGIAQQSPPKPAPKVDNDFLQKQFGEEFKILPAFAPMVADFDGDGVEDIAIAAKAKNPLMDAAERGFKVVDPYYGFFGFGDPKITTTFGSTDPETTAYVLAIIHGSGPQAWRADKPKAKFVVINLPFKQVAVKRVQIRRKLVPAIYAMESGGTEMTSVVYFDGRKYKYEPMGAALH